MSRNAPLVEPFIWSKLKGVILDYDKELTEWQARCLGGPMLWTTSAASFAVLVFYYVVATWGYHS
jgi:hypothetical protein